MASANLAPRAQDVVSSSFPPPSVQVICPPAAVFSIAAETAEGTENTQGQQKTVGVL